MKPASRAAVHLRRLFDYDNDGKLDLFVSSFVVYESL